MGCVGPETQETQVWEWAVCAGMGRYAGTGTDPPVSPRHNKCPNAGETE